ncbi:ABC transporter permease [Agrococcus jejuensis]|uniref:Putative spermidine/putrescine transport system permease protein n=1 Tax=Agrococcus jejuensis TaxID=399736 RepID=A0A1G8D6H3_9MICO|nr:ABC transporter permease [Agrococcus jejuensis]SDH53347.1 putative spermidine/putrescine transport system permease protein [Agrococcus jejuensis]
MTASAQTLAAPPETGVRRASRALDRHPRVGLASLLGLPLGWLVVVYVVSLGFLLVTALWQTDSFTNEVRTEWTLDNLARIVTQDLYRAVTFRTLGAALLVTLIDVAIALPVGYAMAKVFGPRARAALVIAFLMPLWASYLVKAYAWRSIFIEGGLLSSIGISPGFGEAATIITLAYIWLPYVVMPIYAGFERVPDSLVEASSDLGARNLRTFSAVVLPLMYPAIIAGAIFSFSLTLGDYIAVRIVGGSTQFLGTLIYDNVGVAGNVPMAAAVALVPIAVILLFLLAVRRTGALRNL